MTKLMTFTHNSTPLREPLHYTACGLDNVYLASGYEVTEFDGEEYTSIHDVDDLHATIAEFLASQRKVLTGQEIRFIRKYLDMTQRELGHFLGVSDQSVARYEKDLTKLEGASDSVLRLLVAGKADGCINVREVLEVIGASDDVASGELTFSRDDDEWKVAA